MILDDTIVAISSAAAPAARIILRISGPQAGQLFDQISPDSAPVEHATARRSRISFNSSSSFPAWVWPFFKPQSFTGDDLIELHLPGNPLLAKMVLERLLKLGARMAEPGEFSARAFFHGKMDLTQAEGIAATISAANAAELAAARRLMAGELSRRLSPIMESLEEFISLVEIGIDFSEEDLEFLSTAQIAQRCCDLAENLQRLLDESGRFEKLSHEPTIVLAGRPNAGKSTLINFLAGHQRSIVSPVAGTTRDALSAHVHLRRGMVRMLDIAGLEESVPASDEIARQMHELARRAMQEADLLILLRESADNRPPPQLPRAPDLVVHSKIDLHPAPTGELGISAKLATHTDELRRRLDRLAFGDDSPTHSPAQSLALSARHIRAISDALSVLKDIARDSAISPELLAADLRQALDSLGQVLGKVTPDDILGRIFSTFCIGK